MMAIKKIIVLCILGASISSYLVPLSGKSAQTTRSAEHSKAGFSRSSGKKSKKRSSKKRKPKAQKPSRKSSKKQAKRKLVKRASQKPKKRGPKRAPSRLKTKSRRREAKAPSRLAVRVRKIVQAEKSSFTAKSPSVLSAPPVPTHRTFDIVGFDRTSPGLIREGEQLLLALPGEPFKVASNFQLFSGVPTMGHYRGEGYNLRKCMAVMAIPPRSFEAQRLLPENILNAVVGPHGDYTQKFNQLVLKPDVKTYFMLQGMVGDANSDAPTHNMVYHPWVASWSGVRHSAPHIEMGIFNADGVHPIQGSGTSGPIVFNALSARSVSTHPVARPGGYEKLDAMSPDNARLAFDKGREIATFWSVAQSPDKNHVVIVFHLVALTMDAEQELQDAVNRAVRERGNSYVALNQLLGSLEILVGGTKFQRQDTIALHGAVQLLRDLRRK